MTNSDLAGLQRRLRDFAEQRDWRPFHTPKNLAMALSVEAAELLEHFQWLTPEQSADLNEHSREAIGKEIADVMNYLLQLSDALDIDPVAAGHAKLTEVQARFAQVDGDRSP